MNNTVKDMKKFLAREIKDNLPDMVIAGKQRILSNAKAVLLGEGAKEREPEM